MNTPSTPDITKAQILGLITFVAGQAVAFGWLKTMPSQVTLAVVSAVIATALHFADAHLRGKRALAFAAHAVDAVPPAVRASMLDELKGELSTLAKHHAAPAEPAIPPQPTEAVDIPPQSEPAPESAIKDA